MDFFIVVVFLFVEEYLIVYYMVFSIFYIRTFRPIPLPSLFSECYRGL